MQVSLSLTAFDTSQQACWGNSDRYTFENGRLFRVWVAASLLSNRASGQARITAVGPIARVHALPLF